MKNKENKSPFYEERYKNAKIIFLGQPKPSLKTKERLKNDSL